MCHSYLDCGFDDINTYIYILNTAPSPAAEEVSDEQTACLTEDECKAKSEEMGMIFESGAFPTKGCYSKNDKVFWSQGSEEEMISTDLPGVQERVYCDASAASGGTVAPTTTSPTTTPTSSPSTGTPTSTPTVTGPTECELFGEQEHSVHWRRKFATISLVYTLEHVPKYQRIVSRFLTQYVVVTTRHIVMRALLVLH